MMAKLNRFIIRILLILSKWIELSSNIFRQVNGSAV